MCSYAAYCLSSTAAARVWLEQYALELYLLEQRVLLKRSYALELHLLEKRVLLEQYCSSLIVARAECNQAVLA